MAKSKAGGGPNSNKVVRPSYRQGQQRERASKTGTAQLGQAQGNHVTGMGGETKRLDYNGVPIFGGGAAFKSELGNAKAVATVCGPGGSRTVHRTGSQGMQGEPDRGNPMPAKELWPGWEK
jgi:hypothetical protein